MKYTRYDLKREKSTKSFVFFTCIILAAAFILGTFIFKVVFRTSGNLNDNTASTVSQNKVQNTSDKSSSAVDGKSTEFIAVQGGVYKDKNNAAEEKSLLAKYGFPFCIQDSDKTRVFLGVFQEDVGEKMMKSLTDQKIDNSKMAFTIKRDDLCNVEIAEIINANLEILNKLSEQDVKSIQTDELKKWCSSLKSEKTENGNNKLVLKDLTEYVNKLPKEITKDKAEENYMYIFNILKKVKSN
ncbi:MULTISPECIES: hypothetical protein [Clostridium]|uniref:SPOR domain-containing protein n=2 Tax=Clostridium TaxID=1485 RepID=A0A166S2G6_9CLOT|nr:MULTISPECIES: hypothetical protein [Clostridium]ADK13788.1 putative transmembrane protein [Clostridium ljungdahlii DSM 13528]OAA85036.1 hypothetical protein WX45_00794 [Clostridium ljungdahlii DSM 13528]OAA91521.1 hypothetical protein WX73_01675 [Clostridium coskatii]OBR90963.1 hypothetical protein CLCOS_36960 [Clostridium coskatii]